MKKWKPIETAPKDGREILTYCTSNREMFVVFWDEGWQYATSWDFRLILEDDVGEILWRPLPKPPSLDTDR